MKVIIDIPSTAIPKTQDIIDIKVHFISGQVCACDFPFEVVEQEQYYKDLAQSYEKTIQKLTKAISEQEPKTDYKAFAEWVAREVFSDIWDLNKNSFAEIACRKLAKLGMVEESGDNWVLKESEGKE